MVIRSFYIECGSFKPTLLSLIQGGFTSGSTASESSCEAVHLVCNVLVNRLKPLKDRLQDQMGSVEWDTLISQVEVDLLTAATTILRTDIIYDCGQSLNPAVDLGQLLASHLFF